MSFVPVRIKGLLKTTGQTLKERAVDEEISRAGRSNERAEDGV